MSLYQHHLLKNYLGIAFFFLILSIDGAVTFDFFFQRRYSLQFIMKTRYTGVFCPQLWCSGGLTPTANPPVLENLAYFLFDWIIGFSAIEVLVMSEINTLVYFDIETSSGKTRICEISLVAVNTQDVLNLGVTRKEDNQFCEVSFLPRIVNKLTLCVYPMAVVIPLVSDLTGLDRVVSDLTRLDRVALD